MKKLLAIMFLALACGGSELADESGGALAGEAGSSSIGGDIGVTEQALKAQCLGNNHLGINLNGTLPTQCQIDRADNNCHFMAAPVVPHMIVMDHVTWTASERLIWAAADTASSVFNNHFTGWLALGESPWKWYTDTNQGGGSGYISVKKGAVGSGPISGNYTPFDNVISFICDDSSAVTENYSANVRRCNHFVATVDWARLNTWAGTQQQKLIVIEGIGRKLMMLSTGCGVRGTSNDQGLSFSSPIISKVLVPGTWVAGTGAGAQPEDIWIANYRAVQDGSPTLVCF